jgi:hypothetical protein
MDKEDGLEVEQLEQASANEATAAAAAFSSARNEEPAAPATPTPEVPETPVAEVETPEPKPLFLGKTEEEVAALLAEIPSMRDGYRKQIDNLNGQFGKLNGALQKLQQETPKGEAVTVTDEDLADMKGEFPELADLTKTALNNVLKRINLKGGASVDPAAIDERVNSLVKQGISSERAAIHGELLDGLHPNWKEVIGQPVKATYEQLLKDGKSELEALEGATPKTDYRKWLATQPAEYRERLDNSSNAFEIGASIKAFQTAHEEAVKKQTQNKQRLANAVQPTGSVAARGAISEQQAADAAFKNSRGR